LQKIKEYKSVSYQQIENEKIGKLLRTNKKISKYILLQENYFLFRITNAAITPGTQPKAVKIKTINIDPQPWSYTANGGKIMLNKTRNIDI